MEGPRRRQHWFRIQFFIILLQIFFSPKELFNINLSFSSSSSSSFWPKGSPPELVIVPWSSRVCEDSNTIYHLNSPRESKLEARLVSFTHSRTELNSTNPTLEHFGGWVMLFLFTIWRIKKKPFFQFSKKKKSLKRREGESSKTMEMFENPVAWKHRSP